MTDNPRKQLFDEQAALAELERLREAIQAARRAREGASEEFERFVRGFRTPPADVPDAPAVTEPGTPEPHRPTSGPANAVSPQNEAPPPLVTPVTPAVPADDRPATAARPAVSESTLEAAATSPAEATRPAAAATAAMPSAPASRSRKWTGAIVVGILVVLAAIAWAVLGTRADRTPSPSESPASARQQPPDATPSAPAAPSPSTPAATSPSTPAPPVKAAAVSLELSAVNPVWVRVLVDGQKKFEGTIPAGERLEFDGDRTIVVRAGNGGDLLVTSGGRENRFGAAGQPLTRTFARSSGDR